MAISLLGSPLIGQSRRILLSRDRVAVSRPGHDVIDAVANHSTMALDSNFTDLERPLKASTIYGKRIAERHFENYGTTYDKIPHVMISHWSGVSSIQRAMAREVASQAWQTLYAIEQSRNGFRIVPPDSVGDDGAWNISYDWTYIVIAAE